MSQGCSVGSVVVEPSASHAGHNPVMRHCSPAKLRIQEFQSSRRFHYPQWTAATDTSWAAKARRESFDFAPLRRELAKVDQTEIPVAAAMANCKPMGQSGHSSMAVGMIRSPGRALSSLQTRSHGSDAIEGVEPRACLDSCCARTADQRRTYLCPDRHSYAAVHLLRQLLLHHMSVAIGRIRCALRGHAAHHPPGVFCSCAHQDPRTRETVSLGRGGLEDRKTAVLHIAVSFAQSSLPSKLQKALIRAATVEINGIGTAVVLTSSQHLSQPRFSRSNPTSVSEAGTLRLSGDG